MAVRTWESLVARAIGESGEPSPTFTAHYFGQAARLLLAEHVDQEHLLSTVLPHMLSIDPFRGYYVGADGVASRRELATGDAALFWNGDSVETAIFDRADATTSEFMALSEKAVSLIEDLGRLPTVVIDLGAGTGALSLCLMQAAQAAGIKSLHVINVERECAALLSAQIMAEQLEFDRYITNIVADIGAAVAGTTRLWGHLADVVRQIQADGRVIVLTRGALYPFYSIGEYQALFSALICEIKADGLLPVPKTPS